MCINKKLIANRKYTATKKNGGVIPLCRDERQRNIWIPCGQCYICRKKKAREWRMRLTEDVKVNKKCKIVTLTFSTEWLIKIAEKCKGYTGYNLDNEICKWAVKHWRENWRKRYGRSPRHWFITELGHGKTEHVHMHGIVWEDERYKLRDTLLNEVSEIWKYGYVGIGKYDYKTGGMINYVSARTANYFTKYINKIDEQHKEYRQIILTSPGIGKAYLESERAKDNAYREGRTKQQYYLAEGGVLPLAEYFRRKMYSDEQREQMTKEYLDKNIVYIGGKEYPLSVGDGKINMMYKELQAKNARMGYGDGRKNYNRIIMENERRRKKQRERGYLGSK